MHGFVKNFFGCRECATNFQRALEGMGASGMATRREVQMWLWRTHNKVSTFGLQ